MFKFSLVDFSIRRPKLIVWATVALTLLFLTQFPRIRTDTNPKNMLPATSDVRVWNDEVDKTFVSRFRQRLAETGGSNDAGVENVREALLWTAARPGKGILRNAVLFAAAFSVMLFAPLTPYMVVGAFIVAMMLLSALLTILYLPALVMLGRRWLIPNKGD